MKLICVAGFLLIFADLSLANSFHDDSHYVRLGPRTGYYVVRDGSRLSHQLGVDDGPYVDTADPLRMAMARTCWRFGSIKPVD
jgi:hypothetical protein